MELQLDTFSPVLLRWNQTSRRLHTMCLSCSRNENRRLYLFMQLSVMMMFNGQSTWEMTQRKRGGGVWGGNSVQRCESVKEKKREKRKTGKRESEE